MKQKKMIAMLAATALAAPGAALATNGYFSHGYGIKAKGMAGVGIALPQDSLAAATNPAGMVMVGDRLDFGLDWFMPRRSAQISGTALGIDGNYSGDGDKNFFIPEFGYNRMLSPSMALGVSVYGNGGMNTRYENSPFATGALAFFGGQNPAGVNLEQLFIAPTFSLKLTNAHAIGASLVLAHQRYSADGLQAFAGFSSSPGDLTNRGNDKSNGWGVRVGWSGKLSDALTLGATYASKTRMSKFDKYKGLFAEQGRFDIPENYGLGIAIAATPKLTLAADVQRINYGKIKAIANPVDCLASGCQLGAANGPGFGWRDVTTYKLGVSYEYSPQLTLRGGFSTNRQPIPARQTFFNILAPATVEQHLTLGATWTLANKDELTIGYMHAFRKTVNGSGSIAATGFGPGEVSLRMKEDSLGIAYGVKLQ